MTGSSAGGAAASLCASRWGIVNRAGTRGTHRGGCAEQGGSRRSGAEGAFRGESWHDAPGSTRISPTCSVWWRKELPMSAEIRQIVARTWTEYIGVPPEWSREQTEEFFTEEATRMADRISRMQAEAQLVVIRQWREAHNGNQPDYLTQVGLINAARAQCQEIVLSEELFEQVQEEDEDTYPAGEWDESNWNRLPEGNEAWAVAARENPDRWTTVFRSDPTKEIVEAVAALWPERSPIFQFYMELLWQSRVEDDKAVPAVEAVPRTKLVARRANAAVMEEMTRVVAAEEHRREQEDAEFLARRRSRMS